MFSIARHGNAGAFAGTPSRFLLRDGATNRGTSKTMKLNYTELIANCALKLASAHNYK